MDKMIWEGWTVKDFIDWSWLWVLSSVWISLVLTIVLVIIMKALADCCQNAGSKHITMKNLRYNNRRSDTE